MFPSIMFHSTTVILSVVLMLWLISVRAHVKVCMKYMYIYIVSSTRIRVWVRPIQTSHTADDVEKVNGRPGKRHAKTSETRA